MADVAPSSSRDDATRVLAWHWPTAQFRCMCGDEWTPHHLAERLDAAGLLI